MVLSPHQWVRQSCWTRLTMAKNWAWLSLQGTRCWGPLVGQGWIADKLIVWQSTRTHTLLWHSMTQTMSGVCKSWLIFWDTSVGDLILVGNCSLHFLSCGLGSWWNKERGVSSLHDFSAGPQRMQRNGRTRSSAISPRHPHGWLFSGLCPNVPSQWGLLPPWISLFPSFVLFFSKTLISHPLTVYFTHLFIISFPQLECKLREGKDFHVFGPHCIPSNYKSAYLVTDI